MSAEQFLNKPDIKISVKPSPFYSSKYSSHLRLSDQEMIASIKGEIRLELANETFSLEENPSSTHLPFKNKLVFFET